MWIANKYNGKTEFKRDGLCNSLIYKKDKGIDVVINEEEKQIIFGNKSKGYVLTDEIGVSGALDCIVFFVHDGIVIEIEKGCVYLRSKHNSIFNVDENGEIEIAEISTEITWKQADELRQMIENFIKIKFHLDEHRELVKEYVDNLACELEITYKGGDSKDFTVHLVNTYSTLSLGEYDFKDYSRIEIEDKIGNKVDDIVKEEDGEYIIFR